MFQCFGNVWWSGVSRLTVGARAEDVESITGFDEGPVPENWSELLENKSPVVKVQRDVLRSEAVEVLKRYKEKGGLVYNPGSGKS